VFFLVMFPIYVFFATRFSPVFAMTVKERRIAFGDAWIASRGRFWPILGAYLILAIVGGMVIGFASSLAQMLLTPAFMSSVSTAEDADALRSIFTPVLTSALLAYTFIRYFLSGLLMHIVQGPAAFAARHDPRGSVDDALSVSEFD
jgi:ABC-type multidrug transport system fused ATPase/permease subunit